jgi:hypothetical protein
MADPYLSEIKYLGNKNEDFIEIAVDPGADISDLYVVNYNQNGTVKSTTNLAAAGVSGPTRSGGRDIYVVDDSTNFNGLNKKGAIALVASADGTTADAVYGFYSFDDQAGVVNATAGLANGLSSVDIGSAPSGQSLIIRKSDAIDPDVTDATAFTVNTSPTEGTIPCFCAGTWITTVTGQKPVETLRAGDLVVTLDHGVKQVRWVGHRRVRGVSRFDPKMRPVVLRAGSEPIFPSTDLWMSRSHRILIRHGIVETLFGTPEVLIPAHILAEAQEIAPSTMLPDQFDYFHILFDAHQIIFANGSPVESLHPGHIALSGFGVSGNLLSLAGVHDDYGPTVRRCLRRWEAERLSHAMGLPLSGAHRS